MKYPKVCGVDLAEGFSRLMPEIWVVVCRSCGTFGAASVGPDVNEYFEERIRAHEGHDWEICGDDECEVVHWGEWSHRRIASMLSGEDRPWLAVQYFGNF